MLDLDRQRVLVLGLGITGQSAARFCARRGAKVVAHDSRADLQAKALPSNVALQLGGPPPASADFDLVVPSPGVAPAHYTRGARRIWGDLELAWRALDAPVVAITGTNGKSTTVRLVEAMLRAGGLRARAAGNLGEPALALVDEELDVAVLEVSSFQLQSVAGFRPRVAALLNCSPDHLDRHGDLSRYRATKLRIFAQQRADDVAIVNGDDPELVESTNKAVARRWCFALEKPVAQGARLEADTLLLDTCTEKRRLPFVANALPPGPPVGNALAALLCAHAFEVEMEVALGALANFRTLPHRLELVTVRDGVRWVDDSKATNPGAACAALGSFGSLRAQNECGACVLWIAGGRDKGAGFAELRAALPGREIRLLAIGEAADALAAELGDQLTVETPGTLERAVRRARTLAKPGDTVLLSPACASHDQFENFEQRGRLFRALALEEEVS